MYRRVIAIVCILGISICAASGCNKQEIVDLKTKNEQQNADLVRLYKDLAELQSANTQASTKMYTLTQENDSLQKISQAQSKKNSQLSRALAQVEAKAKQDLQEFAEATVIFKQREKRCDTEKEELSNMLAKSYAENVAYKQSNDSLKLYILVAGQWRDYYRQESHRSWWKKFWGAGKATRPKFTEPSK